MTKVDASKQASPSQPASRKNGHQSLAFLEEWWRGTFLTVGTTLLSASFPGVILTDGLLHTHTRAHTYTYTQTDHVHTEHSVCNSVFLPKISFKQEHFYPLLFCE